MRTSVSSFVLVALAGSLALACGSTQPAPDPEGEVVASSQARDTNPAVSTEDRAQLAQDNLAFAFDLTKRVAATDPKANAFLSPYSISVALAMLSAGARGATAAEMATALRFSLPQDRLHPAFDALDLALTQTADSGIKLNVANSLWAERTSSFETPFLDTLAKDYGAGVHLADFLGQPDDARVHINDWTEGKTEGRIKDLLPKGTIDQSTRLVLVNAIYFNAKWNSPFDAHATAAAPFTRRDGSQVSADLMATSAELAYAETDAYQAVDLPYTGQSTSMIVVLPRADKLDAFESGLDAAAFTAIEQGMHGVQVNLKLPKFEIAGASFSVADHLKAMGMSNAFGTGADFSGISTKEQLSVSDVVHKAFVKVDESGTEAAAATAVGVGATSAPQQTKTLTVDHPFYVFLRDNKSHTVLFAGRITDPTAQ